MSRDDWTNFASSPPEVGVLIELRVRDCLGSYDLVGPFHLNDDGRFYRIDPPMMIIPKPTHWRPYLNAAEFLKNLTRKAKHEVQTRTCVKNHPRFNADDKGKRQVRRRLRARDPRLG